METLKLSWAGKKFNAIAIKPRAQCLNDLKSVHTSKAYEGNTTFVGTAR